MEEILAVMRLLLIDGLNFIRRIYAAVPADADEHRHFQGFLDSIRGSLRRALSEAEPSHAACVMEGEEHPWRRAIHAAYKSGRSPMPGALQAGLPEVERLFQAEGVATLEFPGEEAMDILATVAAKVAASGKQTLILSTNRHLCQLLRPGIEIRDHFARCALDAAYVDEHLGFWPQQLDTYYALAGDPAAHIPGIKGIGQKSALQLIERYGDLDAIFAAASEISGRAGKLLADGQEMAEMSLKLVRPREQLDLGINLRELRFCPPQPPE